MWGFGSPHSFGIPSVATGAGKTPGADSTAPVSTSHYDWGFGDPNPVAFPVTFIEEWGFGEPVPSLVTAHMVGTSLMPDDGGVLVSLIGEWPIIGPYRVQLRHTTTNQEFPLSGEAWGCAAPLRTDFMGWVKDRAHPYFCYTNFARKEEVNITLFTPGKYLEFTMPPCPPGFYNIDIYWGSDALLNQEFDEDPLIPSELALVGAKWAADMNNKLTLENVLQVVYRGRETETYHARMSFPENYSTGPRGSDLENTLGTTQDDYDG